MNVQELIDLLQQVQDKSLRVMLATDDENYDIETVDTGTDRVYIDAVASQSILKTSAISSVLWVAESKEFDTYEFELKDYIEVEENEVDLLRFFSWHESGNMEVLVANRDDYFIHEDVSDRFNLPELAKFLDSQQCEDISEDFNEWLERHDEPVD